MRLINGPCKFEWRNYSIEIFFHHGRQKFGFEIYDNKLDWLHAPMASDPDAFFDTIDQLVDHLRKFGYHNVSRFLLGDEDETNQCNSETKM
jgi:hypothetical protein